MDRHELLTEIHDRLASAHGARFRGAVVYGSVARGDDDPDSDLDVLVLLTGPVHLGEDIRIAVEALYPLTMRTGHPVHVVPADAENYERGVIGLYRVVREEGIAL